MAAKAESTDIIHVTFPAALRYRQNVIGVPQAFAHPCLHSPMPQQGHTACAARAFQPEVLLDGIYTAVGAAPPIAFEYLLSQIPWL
jgi:hypothetical protein